jgi:hypothetical protein
MAFEFLSENAVFLQSLAATIAIATALFGIAAFLRKRISGWEQYFSTKNGINNDFSVQGNEIILSVKDKEGRKALYSNKGTLKAKKNGAQIVYVFLHASGSIENVETSIGNIESREYDAAQIKVCIKLDRPYQKGEMVTVIISAVFLDSFIHEKEGLVYQPFENKKSASISVEIPNSRKLKSLSSRIKKRQFGEYKTVYDSIQEFTHNRYTKYTWDLGKARADYTYSIEWVW